MASTRATKSGFAAEAQRKVGNASNLKILKKRALEIGLSQRLTGLERPVDVTTLPLLISTKPNEYHLKVFGNN